MFETAAFGPNGTTIASAMHADNNLESDFFWKSVKAAGTVERLVDVVQRVANERNRERVGRLEEVLVEGPSRTDAALLRGRTRRNTTVNFAGVAQPGDLVSVAIESATSQTLHGRQLAAVAA